MKRNILLLAACLFCFAAPIFGQLNLNLSLKYQISSPGSTGNSPNFTVAGFVGDDLSRWDATNVAAGDSLYVVDGSDLYVFVVQSINSAGGNSLNMNVRALDDNLSQIPPGQAAIIRPTAILKLPTFVSTLRDDLRSTILNRLSQLIDDKVLASVIVSPRLTGNGRTGSPLDLAQQGATTNQVLKWNGSNWVPGTISGGGASTLMGLNDVDTTGITNGQILQYNSTTGNWETVDPVSANVTFTEALVEGSTATTIDLDANDGVLKYPDGTNAVMTIPADLNQIRIYKNGSRLTRNGSTTRDYSLNTSNNQVTLSSSLYITDRLVIEKN